jgi:NADPH:quinone reductase-like Zn-dependent oxidoreductase
MKAIVWPEYGGADVLRYEDVPKPAPASDQVLIRVRAASINPVDWRMMPGRPRLMRLFLGLQRPKSTSIGRDVAGTVEAVGTSITRFQPGDEVFGISPAAFAEWACAREAALALKPASVDFDQAAAIPVAAYTALQGLRDHGQLQSGQRVLINGAAGGVGTYAVQFAKVLGAHVTGVCSTRNVELVRSLGADRVIDYTRDDFTCEHERYDLILDCAGNHSLAECRRAMTPTGTLLMVGVPHDPKGLIVKILGRMMEAMLRSKLTKQRFPIFMAKSSAADLAYIGELMAAGQVKSVIVEPRYRLREVPEAIALQMAGHARGKLVVIVGPEDA